MLSILLSIIFLLSIVNAEKFAIIYGSLEHLTNTELPSSACRFYDYLESQNFKKSNIIYMLDTTDYNMDYTDTYTNWFEGNNYYLRDDVYQHSCSNVEFEGEYVTPRFLLYYLIGDEKHIQKLSGKSNPRIIHPTMDDTIVVYFADSHGSSSEYHPDRIIDPDLVKKAVLIMKKHKLFHKLLFFAEAGYSDYAFHKLERMKNVLALTIKDPSDSGRFTHVYPSDEEDKMNYLESVWDTTWPSLLPLTCGESLSYLYQVATSAILQVPGQLLIPGIWGDREMLDMPLNDFIAENENCKPFFAFKEGEVDRDDLKSLLTESFMKNMNNTVSMQQSRKLHMAYETFIGNAVEASQKKKWEENQDFPIAQEGCVDFLVYNIRNTCDYYMPLADSIVNTLSMMCRNRQTEGILMVNFEAWCKKNNPAKQLE